MRFIIALLALASTAGATDFTVCASGCSFNNLQTAIDSPSVNGDDKLILKAGEQFTTTTQFTLKAGLTGPVTIESSELYGLVYLGRRVSPSDTALMPKVMTSSTGGANGVFVTAHGAGKWRLRGLWLTKSAYGLANNATGFIQLGDGSFTTGEDRDTHPSGFVIDRCLVDGVEFDKGPQRMILINATDVAVTNSYVFGSEFPAASGESHGISGWNAFGRWWIYNNYISTGGENFFNGGARGKLDATMENIHFVGNWNHRANNHLTINMLNPPQGTTFPTVPAPIQSQTFVLDPDGTANTGDEELHIFGTTPGWRQMNVMAADFMCSPTRLWRNWTDDTLWTCNSQGQWQAGGTDLYNAPIPAESVAEGNPTRITMPAMSVANMNNHECQSWYEEASCVPNVTQGAYVNITGATGACAALNSRFRITYVTQSPSVFSVPFNSTGLAGCDTVTIQAQYLWAPNKNSGEFKRIWGGVVRGNRFENSWTRTFFNQKGDMWLLNWLPDQDGVNSTIQAVRLFNNYGSNVGAGFKQGSIDCDNIVSGGVITKGNPTTFNLGNCNVFDGEEVFLDMITDPGGWAGIAGKWYGTNLTFNDFTIPFNSTGLPGTPTLRLYTGYWQKSNRWWRNIYYANNLLELGNPEHLTNYTKWQGQTSGATYFGSRVVGNQIYVRDGRIVHNSFMKRAMSDGFWLSSHPSTTPSNIVGINSPIKAIQPTNVEYVDNIQDAGGGMLSDLNDLGQGCNKALANLQGGYLRVAGNIGTYTGIRTTDNEVFRSNNINGPCLDWGKRFWERTSTGTQIPGDTTLSSAVVSVDSGLCPSAPGNKRLRLQFSAASRMVAGSVRITAATPPGGSTPPNDIIGIWYQPSSGENNLTSWDMCASTNLATGTYTGVTLESNPGYTDFANKNYRIAPGGMAKGLASDGSDPGVDQNVVEWSIAGTQTGVFNPYLDMGITGIVTTATTAAFDYRGYDTGTCSLTISPTRSYASDAGTEPAHTRSGRFGQVTVTGLTANTHYFVRLTCGTFYADQFPDGEYAEFNTRP